MNIYIIKIMFEYQIKLKLIEDMNNKVFLKHTYTDASKHKKKKKKKSMRYNGTENT